MPRHPDTMVEPNTQFVAARNRQPSVRRPGRPMSRIDLADTVNAALDELFPGQDMRAQYVDGRWIGKLERGESRWPARERRVALRHVLQAREDAELGLFPIRRAPHTPATSPHDEGSTALTNHGSAPGFEALDSADAWLGRLGELTIAVRGGVTMRLLDQVREHLLVLERLQRDDARPELASADARWSEFGSWLADNVGEPDGAAWLHRAHQRAAATGDQVLSAYALMRHSQHALDGGDVRAAIALARRSLTHGPVPARTAVLCLTRTAEALAACGDDTTVTVVAQARRRIRGAGTDPADEFASHCDLSYVTAVDARCRQLLGDTASAAAILEELLTDPASAAFDAGIWHANLGACYQTGDPPRAARHGIQALQLGNLAGSYRTVRAVQPLAVALRQHRSLPDVRAFLDMHRQAVTSPVPR